ncbi:hypothetical protein [Nocardioides sp. CFH 31398]|uniref:hypothetical protein n=1 Tax=Nocardioides sp. CFH 31398 TaxID=2919579 RepID=UPI001F064029|nr:hypothetical protein [Nocardioides sp. CFH 31398]MCH1867097.1 hypothetical protein [Nocardioides sp. CFH 31398]
MTAVCTTPSEAGTNETPTPARPKRRQVEHLFWVSAMNAAADMGVQCRTLCGHWQFIDGRPTAREHLQTVGRLVPLPEPEDCKNCLRAFVAHQRRQYDKGAR